jgi:large subunit ribosomal protein L37Ae
MAEKEKKKRSVKRFGARYGRTIRYRLAIIESEQKKKHKCPSCNAERVKRIAVGIWHCRKCDAKFTGRAYSLAKRVTIKNEIKEEKEIEEKVEEGVEE